MTREIDRRFLLKEAPPGVPGGTPVRQGYVAIDGEAQVRVRDAGGVRTLTVKGSTGRDRVEVEREIPRWFGEEVTGRPEWGNVSLAVHGRP